MAKPDQDRGPDTARTLSRALSTLHQESDGTMPVHAAAILFMVAEYERLGEELDMGAVGRALGMSPAHVSRDMGILTSFSRSKDGGGLELIEARMDLRDRRRRILTLSVRGKRLIEEIERRA